MSADGRARFDALAKLAPPFEVSGEDAAAIFAASGAERERLVEAARQKFNRRAVGHHDTAEAREHALIAAAKSRADWRSKRTA